MGNSTNYEGSVKISPELRAGDIVYLEKFLNSDTRDDIGWIRNERFRELASATTYTALEFSDDYQSLRWHGGEKTNGMAEQINYLISAMRERLPSFDLSGQFNAQGEEIGDVYNITKDSDGYFSDKQLQIEGDIIQCPCCEENFVLKPEYRVDQKA